MRDAMSAIIDIRGMYHRAAEAYLSEPDERIAKKYLSFAEECFNLAVELSGRIK